jgi:hypothetical protein
VRPTVGVAVARRPVARGESNGYLQGHDTGIWLCYVRARLAAWGSGLLVPATSPSPPLGGRASPRHGPATWATEAEQGAP